MNWPRSSCLVMYMEQGSKIFTRRRRDGIEFMRIPSSWGNLGRELECAFTSCCRCVYGAGEEQVTD